MTKKNKRSVTIEPTSSESSPASVSRGPAFEPDYSPVIRDLRRIGILAGGFITLLIVLTFFLR